VQTETQESDVMQHLKPEILLKFPPLYTSCSITSSSSTAVMCIVLILDDKTNDVMMSRVY